MNISNRCRLPRKQAGLQEESCSPLILLVSSDLPRLEKIDLATIWMEFSK